MKSIRIAAGVVGFTLASGAGAQDSDMADLGPAIHATRLEYSKFEAPEAVTVITQDDIREAGFLEVSEVFRAVPGFRIVKDGDEVRLGYHGTTGRPNRRMLVTINGRSILTSDGEWIDLDRIPLDFEDIARITITRGPNGAAYGDNAFAVSVDFQTIGSDDATGVTARGGGGSNARQKYGISGNENIGGFQLTFSAGHERDGGYDYYNDANHTKKDDGMEIDRGHVAIEKTFADVSRWRLEASGFDSEHKIGIPPLHLRGYQKDDGAFFTLTNEWELGANSRLDWHLGHTRQTEHHQFNGCYTPDTISDAIARGMESSILPAYFLPQLLGVSQADTCFFNDLRMKSKRTEGEVEFQSVRGPWRYLLGGSIGRTEADSDEFFSGVNPHQDSKRAFVETTYAIGQVHLSAGGMAQDADNVSHTQYAWRGAVNWAFQPNQVLRYTYATSFRIPSLSETETFWTTQYYFGIRGQPHSTYTISLPVPLITNTEVVEPEKIHAHSLGYFGSFLNNRATIDAKVFREKIIDPIRSGEPFVSLPPSNDEGFDQRGFETELGLRLNEQWKLGGQYSYLDSDAKTTFETGLQGKHAGSLFVTYRFLPAHTITTAYYGNSKISNNSYDRYDVVYNFHHSFGRQDFRFQFIYQRHVGGVDGFGPPESTDDRGQLPVTFVEESVYKHLNQFYAFAELTF